MENLWIGVIVIVIILVILYFLIDKSSKLNGVWVADDSFCDQAEIDMMALILTNGKAFILVINGEGNIDHLTRYSISGNSITFKEGFESFPKCQKFKTKDDRLLLTSGDTIHFAGYRDSELSCKLKF